MTDERVVIRQGDHLTIDGVYADGTQAPPYIVDKPLKKWACIEIVEKDGSRAYRLCPLHDDGTVDEFNHSVGRFEIIEGRGVMR